MDGNAKYHSRPGRLVLPGLFLGPDTATSLCAFFCDAARAVVAHMAGFSIKIDMGADIQRLAADFEQFSEKALPRASQFVANRVAIDAVRRFRVRVPEVLDNPTEATVDAASYKLDREALNSITRVDQVKATVYINPVASIWMKYGFGDSANRRDPGDVGLAEDAIMLPVWENIRIVMKQGPDRHGNVPKGMMKRVKAMIGSPVKGKWTAYEGQMTINGKQVNTIVGRPPTKLAPGYKTKFVDYSGAAPRKRKVNKVVATDRRRPLFIDVPHADYEPVLQDPWDESVTEAGSMFGKWLDDELDEKRAHRIKKELAKRDAGLPSDMSFVPAFLR